jgi:acyl dehydratase
MGVFRTRARNVALDSGNPMHSQEQAAALGLSGPPIAGMTTIDYAVAAIVHTWGGQWPRRAGFDFRLLNLIEDGCDITITVTDGLDELRCVVSSPTGDPGLPGAVVSAWPTGPGSLESWARPYSPESSGGVPERRSPAELTAPLRLRLWEFGNIAEINAKHLEEMERVDGSGPFVDLRSEGFVMPGTLADVANQIVMSNICTGSWIHARTRMQFHDFVRVGEDLSAHSVIVESRDHADGRFVALDISVLRDRAVVVRMEHVAIV